MRQDLKLLFLYKNHIPRRELINYMTTLMVFHAALYFFQTVRIANWMVREGKLPSARGPLPRQESAFQRAFRSGFLLRLDEWHDPTVDELAKAHYTAHFKEIEQYFKSAYLMKKLEEFAGSYLSAEQRKERGRAYIDLLLKGLGTIAIGMDILHVTFRHPRERLR